MSSINRTCAEFIVVALVLMSKSNVADPYAAGSRVIIFVAWAPPIESAGTVFFHMVHYFWIRYNHVAPHTAEQTCVLLHID